MKFEHTIASLQRGMIVQLSRALEDDLLISIRRLLTSPFDYSQAFDQALKNVIKTLGSRPEKEKSDEVVCLMFMAHGTWMTEAD